jgi:hypothetical protein
MESPEVHCCCFVVPELPGCLQGVGVFKNYSSVHFAMEIFHCIEPVRFGGHQHWPGVS